MCAGSAGSAGSLTQHSGQHGHTGSLGAAEAGARELSERRSSGKLLDDDARSMSDGPKDSAVCAAARLRGLHQLPSTADRAA